MDGRKIIIKSPISKQVKLLNRSIVAIVPDISFAGIRSILLASYNRSKQKTIKQCKITPVGRNIL
jgi:hypothetical protein